jgi:L,D-peptidoglycan transpeptidase YkuD (ErfK/YbiS/YcfS/YnhG family)
MLTFALALALQGCPQRIQVTAPRTRSTTATLVVRECGKRVLGPWRARVGRNGLSAHHREGDGTTPTGTFAIGPVVYGMDPDPGVSRRYHRLVCGDWWDEDARSATYNTFRHVAWRITPAYRLFAVIQYNAAPVVPGRGSAIFLHVDTGHPTNGCVSLPRTELRSLLVQLRPGVTISIQTA